MDPLTHAAIEQSAYDRQARMRNEALNEYLVRLSHDNESATASRWRLKLALALAAALLLILAISAFVLHAASVSGDGGARWLFY